MGDASLEVEKYRTHVFDLDGTLLLSNQVKSQAFLGRRCPMASRRRSAWWRYTRRRGR